MNGPSNQWGMEEEIERISQKLFLYVQSNEEMRDNGYAFVEVWMEFRDVIAEEVQNLEMVDWLDLARILPEIELNTSAESINAFFNCDGFHGHFEHCYTLAECMEYNAMAWVFDQIWNRTIDLADERYAQINKKQTRI